MKRQVRRFKTATTKTRNSIKVGDYFLCYLGGSKHAREKGIGEIVEGVMGEYISITLKDREMWLPRGNLIKKLPKTKYPELYL